MTLNFQERYDRTIIANKTLELIGVSQHIDNIESNDVKSIEVRSIRSNMDYAVVKIVNDVMSRHFLKHKLLDKDVRDDTVQTSPKFKKDIYYVIPSDFLGMIDRTAESSPISIIDDRIISDRDDLSILYLAYPTYNQIVPNGFLFSVALILASIISRSISQTPAKADGFDLLATRTSMDIKSRELEGFDLVKQNFWYRNSITPLRGGVYGLNGGLRFNS